MVQAQPTVSGFSPVWLWWPDRTGTINNSESFRESKIIHEVIESGRLEGRRL
jgi:hypothetical protein